MELQQLKTFVVVARSGTITRASEVLHLSQPAVSAQIKALEDTLGLALFERTARGMALTPDGVRLLAKAERSLAVHQELLDEATRIKGRLTGSLRLGAGSNSDHQGVGRLLTTFAEKAPEVDVVLKHGTSAEILAGIRDGSLDAGFYNEPGEPDPDLSTVEVSRFRIFVAGAPELVDKGRSSDWSELAELPWIYPAASACCGRTAENLFKAQGVRPKRVISVDREDVTRTLVAGGIGIGLLHETTARRAKARGQVELLLETPTIVRVLFAHRASRQDEPVLAAAMGILRAGANP